MKHSVGCSDHSLTTIPWQKIRDWKVNFVSFNRFSDSFANRCGAKSKLAVVYSLMVSLYLSGDKLLGSLKCL